MRVAILILAGLLAGCAAPSRPADDRVTAMRIESAVIRERIRFLRAEVMGTAFALMQAGAECPDRQVAAKAAELHQRAAAYYRAALAHAPDQAISFEAHSRSTAARLPAGRPSARFCAAIQSDLAETDRVMRDAGV
jgi:hypothetical protein